MLIRVQASRWTGVFVAETGFGRNPHPDGGLERVISSTIAYASKQVSVMSLPGRISRFNYSKEICSAAGSSSAGLLAERSFETVQPTNRFPIGFGNCLNCLLIRLLLFVRQIDATAAIPEVSPTQVKADTSGRLTEHADRLSVPAGSFGSRAGWFNASPTFSGTSNHMRIPSFMSCAWLNVTEPLTGVSVPSSTIWGPPEYDGSATPLLCASSIWYLTSRSPPSPRAVNTWGSLST